MKHFRHHPHRLHFQAMQDLSGQFDEKSPLRLLFHSSMDFEYAIETVTTEGPIHECVNTVFILKICESLLCMIQQDGMEIKPIDGVIIKSFSPHFAEMTLPLQFPKSVLEANTMKIDASEFIGEGPVERTLVNALIISALYYLDLYFQTNKKRKET